MIKKYNQCIFIDSSDVKVIKKWNSTGVVDGVTTNPQIMLNDGVTKSSYYKVIAEICKEMGEKSVSIELTSNRTDYKAQMTEAIELSKISENITIKIPFNPLDTMSLDLMHEMSVKKNLSVNATVMMNYEQLVLASKAMRNSKNACFVSLFWGRALEDWSNRNSENYAPNHLRMGQESFVDCRPDFISRHIVESFNKPDMANMNLIVGSVRNATMVGEALATGANIVTVPAGILEAMMFSKRAVETLEQFDAAWNDLQNKK